MPRPSPVSPISSQRVALSPDCHDFCHSYAFGLSASETTVSRHLKALGFRKLSARPRHHAQNEAAIEAFKKASRPSWTRSKRACRPASA